MNDVLFITVDSLRADHVGWHGYERPTTPNLDRLAEENHSLLNAYANGCGTNRSFPAILTSTHPLMHGGYESLTEDRDLLAESLQSAGFQTAGLHSNPYLLGKFGYDRGFDRFFTSKSETDTLGKARQWVKDTFDDDNPIFRTLKWAFDVSEKKAGFNPGTPFVRADEKTDRAIEWVEDMDGDRSRFLWVHYMDVHHPYAPPEEYQLRFRDDPVGQREAVQLRRKMLDEPDAVTDEELKTIIDLYDGEVRFFDEQAGRLIDAVTDEWGSDTLVAFTSDHGDELLDHGGFSHYNTYYDELLHVPLVFDINDDGGTHDELVELLDVAPTLVDYAGVDAPDSYQGSSLRPLFEGGEWLKSSVIAESTGNRAVRTEQWKYVQLEDEEKLFDLTADPDETTDVLGENPGVVDEMTQIIEAHEARIEETSREVDDVTIDEETEKHLEQLGYR